VTMCRVRTISRKDLLVEEVSSETVRQPPPGWEAKIQSELHGDVERSTEMIDPLERGAPVQVTLERAALVTDLSEIPCRVRINACPAAS